MKIIHLIKTWLLEIVFILLWLLVIVIFPTLVFAVYLTTLSNDTDSFFKLLVPIGIILSAALASLSLMKSIDNTNRIERNKKLNLEKSSTEFIQFMLLDLHHQLLILNSGYQSLSRLNKYSLKDYFNDSVNIDEEFKNYIATYPDTKEVTFFNQQIIDSDFVINNLWEKINDKDLVYNSTQENKEIIVNLKRILFAINKTFKSIQKSYGDYKYQESNIGYNESKKEYLTQLVTLDITLKKFMEFVDNTLLEEYKVV